jgi:hypothetical protein
MMRPKSRTTQEVTMSITLSLRTLSLAALLACAVAAPVRAATPSSAPGTPPGTMANASNAAPASVQPEKSKHKKKKSSTVKYDKGSAETTAERDRRLKRECKGRPNAGACLGYAS